MEPTKAARLRDYAVAAAILVAVGVFFVMSAIKAGIIGHYSHFSQLSEPDADDNPIPPKEIQQYVAVYKAMQHNHSLTVEQACTQQGLTVAAFRDIERRIERNDQVRTKVREELQAKSKAPAGPKSSSP